MEPFRRNEGGSINTRTHIEEKNGISYIAFDSLERTMVVVHGFSTRSGGVSMPPYDSLNLGLTTGDSRDSVLENRKIFGSAMGFYPEESILLDHEREVYNITGESHGPIPVADAVITKIPKVPLTIFYADCVPIFILDSKTPSIGLTHAGWRGTVKNVAGHTLDKMKSSFGSEDRYLIAGIGPSIGPCCFLVDEDVALKFLETFRDWKDLIQKTSNNKWSIDLRRINERLLLAGGVRQENITISSLCTACNPGMFYSYRRDKSQSGRMAAILVLSGESQTPH